MAKTPQKDHFAVSRSAKTGAFQEIKTGKSVSRIMNKRLFEDATQRADTKIREYVGSTKAS